MLGTIAVCHLFLSSPARRQERARLFLDLLRTGIAMGQSPERTIVAVSETRERSVSVHFHLLAAHIEEGLSLAQALGRAPRLLPPGVAEAVKIGASEGTLDRMLPAARTMLATANSGMRSALNYIIVFLVVVMPATLFLLPMLTNFVWPRFKALLEDMEVSPPYFAELVFENVAVASGIEALVIGSILFFAFFYVGGPRALFWSNKILGGLPDRFLLWLPWRRNRIHRDFTAVLGILLDAGLAEERAVELAARASANRLFQCRAEAVIARLREGVALPEALRKLERDREFQWRWRNALRSGKGFFDALRGWHETLEARAFQQEQAAAHVITTGIVVLNGALVGVIAVAVFMVLLSILEGAVLW